MELGFIGLGHVGQPIAPNLLKAGHRVIVYNRTRRRAEALAADGAEVAERPAGTCRGEAAVTMLAGDAALESVVFGAEGILGALALKTVSLTIGFRHRAPLVGGMATRPNFSTFHEAFTTCRGCALMAARNQCVYDVASGFA